MFWDVCSMHIYTYIYIYIYICTYIHTCFFIYIFRLHMSLWNCLHTYIHTYVLTYRHTYRIPRKISFLLRAVFGCLSHHKSCLLEMCLSWFWVLFAVTLLRENALFVFVGRLKLSAKTSLFVSVRKRERLWEMYAYIYVIDMYACMDVHIQERYECTHIDRNECVYTRTCHKCMCVCVSFQRMDA